MHGRPLQLIAGWVLALVAASASASCCCDVEQRIETEGVLRLAQHDSWAPPFPEAVIELSRDALVVEYTAEDGYRYRVTYDVESRIDSSLTTFGFPGLPCDRALSGDFAGHPGLLAGAAEVNGNVTLEGYANSSLPDLDECLERIGGDLVIRDNEALAHVWGLESVQAIGGSVRISGNSALADARALEDTTLEATDGVIEIVDNPMLPQCEAETLASALEPPGWTGTTDVRNNLGSCP